MISEKQSPQKNIFKNPFVYSSLLILIVAAYVGWIIFSGHQDTRAYDKRAADAQEKKRRETAQVCFGVANARTVTLEPQNSQVWPSHNLCVDVKTAKTTTYTLTATGADGKSVSRQVTVEVH